jgi:hypothetical protein
MSRRGKGFDFYYKLCADYYKEHGDLEIRQDYTVNVGGEEIKLGGWISNIRKRSSSLRQEQVKKLDELNMNWGKTWEYMFFLYKDYISEYNTPVIKESGVYRGVFLGQWLYGQRRKYNKGELDEKKSCALESLGYEWITGRDHKRQTDIELLRDYRAEKGHLLVNTDEIYKGQKIGKIVKILRIKKKEGTLPEDIAEELNSMGFYWNGLEGFWEHCYNLCVEYNELGYVIRHNTEYRGFKIGSWLSRQRLKQNMEKMGPSKAEQINGILERNRVLREEEERREKEERRARKEREKGSEYNGKDL